MPRVMFGWQWSDGKWYDAPEPKAQKSQDVTPEPQPKQRKPWTPTGFFKNGPHAAREAALRRDNQGHLYIVWLERTFTKPTPARVVLEQAKRQGFALRGVSRARVRLGVKTIRAGGRGTGRNNPWVWLFPADVSQID